MRTLYRKMTARLPNERGQTMLLVVLALGVFLLGAVAFATDIANLWFHRQSAQTAADAACTAGIMDMLYAAEGATTASWVSKIGTANQISDCNGNSSTVAPCWYASKNGYGGADYSAGVPSVALSYPTSNGNITNCTSSFTGTVCAESFLQVNVRDRTRVFFAALLNGGKTTVDVGANAVCAVMEALSPIPLLVLNPTVSGAWSGSGHFSIDIYGGPPRSIQINSSSSSAISVNGCSGGGMNVSQGGPNYTGSNIGVTGAQSATCWTAGTTSTWLDPDAPISDPFAMVCAPGQASECMTTSRNGSAAPAVPSNIIASDTGSGTVPAGTDGCPTGGGACLHFVAGQYTKGIDVKNNSAVFDPGLYYVLGGMSLDANSQVCTGTNAGDGSQGVTFYFADANSVSVAANSGGGQCTNSAGASLTASGTLCSGDSTTELPGNLTASTVLAGNVLLAPCTGYYGDPLGSSDPSGEQRGILFFQDRSFSASPSWGGGGAFALAGSMYFHYCDSSVAGSGEDCNSTSGFTTQLELGGNSGSTSYILGDIVVDELKMHGTPVIDMDLSPTAAYYILKASLLQ